MTCLHYVVFQAKNTYILIILRQILNRRFLFSCKLEHILLIIKYFFGNVYYALFLVDIGLLLHYCSSLMLMPQSSGSTWPRFHQISDFPYNSHEGIYRWKVDESKYLMIKYLRNKVNFALHRRD